MDNVLKYKAENNVLSEKFQKSNINIKERGKVVTPSTQILDPSISCLVLQITSDFRGANVPLLVT